MQSQMNVLKRLDEGLRALYMLSGIMAGALIVLIVVAVMVSIFSRMIGVYVPGITEVSGYMLACAGALALSYGFEENGHIRVLMLVENFRGRVRYLFEVWALLFSVSLVGFLAFYLVRMVYTSWLFEEVSHGSDEMLMWIPQSLMAFGFVLFAICLLHALVKAIFTRHIDTTNESIDFRKKNKGQK